MTQANRENCPVCGKFLFFKEKTGGVTVESSGGFKYVTAKCEGSARKPHGKLVLAFRDPESL